MGSMKYAFVLSRNIFYKNFRKLKRKEASYGNQ